MKLYLEIFFNWWFIYPGAKSFGISQCRANVATTLKSFDRFLARMCLKSLPLSSAKSSRLCSAPSSINNLARGWFEGSFVKISKVPKYCSTKWGLFFSSWFARQIKFSMHIRWYSGNDSLSRGIVEVEHKEKINTRWIKLRTSSFGQQSYAGF